MFKKDSEFYNNPICFEKFFTVFVKGDRLIIYPAVLLAVALFFINKNLPIIFILSFLTIRYFIEIVYWLLQQFVGGQYRPFDYGLKNLSNNSIYIIYQLTSTVTCSLYLTLLVFYLTHVS